MANYHTIKTFQYPHQAYIAKTKLEIEGIDENIILRINK